MTTSLHEFAEKIARLDVLTSHALLAQEKHFCKPLFVEENILSIEE